MFTLYTCNYSSFDPSMGVAIQTSRGGPRWPLRYALDIKVTDLMPEWEWIGLPEPEFADRYADHLDMIGVERLTACLSTIAQAAADQRLVLLCFENLAKSETYCHRRNFAGWWENETEQVVPELGPTL